MLSLFMTTESPWLAEGSMRFVSDDYMAVLEIWIDYDRSPVAIRLAGVLDRTTRSALLSVIDDLIFEGVNTFVIDAGAVEIGDASGADALTLCRRRARRRSGPLMALSGAWMLAHG
jgi:hypothetical protein